MGIGLAICSEILRLHDFKYGAVSKLGMLLSFSYSSKSIYQGWNKFNIKPKIISLYLKFLYVIINKYQKWYLGIIY